MNARLPDVARALGRAACTVLPNHYMTQVMHMQWRWFRGDVMIAPKKLHGCLAPVDFSCGMLEELIKAAEGLVMCAGTDASHAAGQRHSEAVANGGQ